MSQKSNNSIRFVMKNCSSPLTLQWEAFLPCLADYIVLLALCL